MMNKYSCGIVGHRDIPKYDNNKNKQLNNQIDNTIDFLIKIQIDKFLCGMAIGADLMIAKRIIKYRNENNLDVKVKSVIPCENQTLHYTDKQKREYREVLKECEPSDYKYGPYFDGCMLKRNRYIVDNSDFMFAIFDENNTKRGGTLYTINYPKRQNKSIFILDPKTMKVSIENHISKNFR